jgi:riboflavin biosynthesis pyrimidine reductase
MTSIVRVWPGPGAAPLTDDDLVAAYAHGDPVLRMNFVTSLDGAVTIDGYSGGLGGPADKRVFDVLRMLCDALVVGAGTLRHEGYGAIRLRDQFRDWRRAHGMPADPALVVVSSRLDLDPAHAMFTQAPQRPLVLTHDASDKTRRDALSTVADVVASGDYEIDLHAGVRDLRARGFGRLLCEGGPHLFGALAEADQVDEVCLTVAPKLAGPGAGRIIAGRPTPVVDLGLRHILAAGDELLLLYARQP